MIYRQLKCVCVNLQHPQPETVKIYIHGSDLSLIFTFLLLMCLSRMFVNIDSHKYTLSSISLSSTALIAYHGALSIFNLKLVLCPKIYNFLTEKIFGFGLLFTRAKTPHNRWWSEVPGSSEPDWMQPKLGLVILRSINDLLFLVILVGDLITFE